MSTVAQPIEGYLGQLLTYFSSLPTSRLILLLIVNIPIITVAFNVLSQLVSRVQDICIGAIFDICTSSCSVTSRNHLSYSTSCPGLDLLLRTGRIQSNSSLIAGKR